MGEVLRLPFVRAMFYIGQMMKAAILTYNVQRVTKWNAQAEGSSVCWALRLALTGAAWEPERGLIGVTLLTPGQARERVKVLPVRIDTLVRIADAYKAGHIGRDDMASAFRCAVDPLVAR